MVNIQLVGPDLKGILDIKFDKTIRLPANHTEWSSRNEGVDYVDLEYLPSSET